MTAKEYLRKLSLLSSRIEIRKDELNELEEKLVELQQNQYSIKSIGFSHERVQTSGPTSSVENSVIRTQATREKITELKLKLSEMIAEYLEEKDKIISTIEQLQDDRYIKILSMRYIKNLSFKQIIMSDAEGWYYADAQTYKLHGLALSALEKIINTET